MALSSNLKDKIVIKYIIWLTSLFDHLYDVLVLQRMGRAANLWAMLHTGTPDKHVLNVLDQIPM